MPKKKAHGKTRQSQLISTFGPGALLDLPKHSVIVGGLEGWEKGNEVFEPRLIQKLQEVLGGSAVKLYSPPQAVEDHLGDGPGVRVWQFPEWFVTRQEFLVKGLRSRRMVHRTALDKGRWIDEDRKRQEVVPIRFVRACPKGHIDDIGWFDFIHQDGSGSVCRKSNKSLWMDERGTSGDLSEIAVRCDCGMERLVIEGTRRELKPFGGCDGARPWLGSGGNDAFCGEPSRLLVRTASNAYFPQVLSVISLPTEDQGLVGAVDGQWEAYLSDVEDVAELAKYRKKFGPLKEALEGFSDAEVFAEIQRRKGGGGGHAKPIKEAEFEVLSSSKLEVGKNILDGDYYARTLDPAKWNGGTHTHTIERVVLVHRLREVRALAGFTRFEASGPDIQGELEIGVKRAALARDTSWVPATEIRGEGVFIQFKKDAVEAWAAKPSVQVRAKQLNEGFIAWLEEHSKSKREFPGLPYLMLHSLAHALITAVSLECGYPASAIRERVYAGNFGYGILLYTGSVDAEGTLGGLVEVGRRITRHLKKALELVQLCSNDPVCAQHEPHHAQERRFLHGAACHGCLLIAETSCEQFNDFLDRALVVPTVTNQDSAFFS
jgi:hypothetical protein